MADGRRELNALLGFVICGARGCGKTALLEQLLRGREQPAPRNENPVFGAAEPEKGAPLDVAWRCFDTGRRRFVVADVPGGERALRDLAAAASCADLAVVVVDAGTGIDAQTRRCTYVACLMGARTLVLAVNGMDRAGYRQEAFEKIASEFNAFAGRIAHDAQFAVPVNAVAADNVTKKSHYMPWYGGPTLLELLETVATARRTDGGLRMPVREVVRSGDGAGGCAGTVAQGTVATGDPVVVLPSGKSTSVSRITAAEGDLDTAGPGRSVTLVLADGADVESGDVIASAGSPPEMADQFAVHVLWFDDEPLYTGRAYHVRMGSRTMTGQVTEIKHRVDVETLDGRAARHLDAGEIGYCTLSLDRAVPFEPYDRCRALGGFLLVDRAGGAAVGGGVIDFALWRASTVPWQETKVSKAERVALNRHKPVVLWFTGLSGAGKSVLANQVAVRLHARACRTYLLDGDNIRHGLTRDLGFKPEDRVENIRRVGEVSKLFVDAGLIVLVALISPFRNERMMVREMVESGEFIEIHVATPLEDCERRDPKGLYARARAGEIRNFTGIDSPYEEPRNPEIVLSTVGATPDELAERVIGFLAERGVIE